MSWKVKVWLLGLSWETVSRTSSGKFLRVESCYPESFGFLRLCILAVKSFTICSYGDYEDSEDSFLGQTCVEEYARAFDSLGVWAELQLENWATDLTSEGTMSSVFRRRLFYWSRSHQVPEPVWACKGAFYVHCQEMIRGSRDPSLFHCNPCNIWRHTTPK